MAKKLSDLQVLTANRLSDGAPVFLTRDGRWSERIGRARVAREAIAYDLLERIGTAAVAANIVVEPYLVKIEERHAGPLPVRHRERMRLRGPSVRPDLARRAAPVRRCEPERPALAL